MDWTGCQLVEIDGSGLHVRGTAISPQAVLDTWVATHSHDVVRNSFPGLPDDAMYDVIQYGTERLAMDAETEWDWRGCDLVEQVPGRCSGAWTVKGTRIFADTVPAAHQMGESVDEILLDYPSLTEAIVRKLIDYAARQDARAA
jgi:uncharacterized protein (DUF433 family)